MMLSSFSFACWPFVYPFFVLSFVEYLRRPFKDLWFSLSFAALSFLVLFPEDSSHFDFPVLSALSPLLRVSARLCLVPLSAPYPGSFLKAVSWGSCKADLICFSYVRVHSSLLPEFQYLAYLHFIYFPQCFGCFNRRIKLILLFCILA